jgi:hypothetical protein
MSLLGGDCCTPAAAHIQRAETYEERLLLARANSPVTRPTRPPFAFFAKTMRRAGSSAQRREPQLGPLCPYIHSLYRVLLAIREAAPGVSLETASGSSPVYWSDGAKRLGLSVVER